MLSEHITYFHPDWNNTMVTKPEATKFLFRYGCYCFSGEFLNVGPRNSYKGNPLDEIDQLCQKLYRAKKCLRWDYEDQSPSVFCETDLDYEWYKNTKTKEIKCGKRPDSANEQTYGVRPVASNTNSNSGCNLDNCELEHEFLTRLVDLVINQKVYKIKQNANLWTRRYNGRCFHMRSLNAQASPYDQCCGEGLDRAPYNSNQFDCVKNELVKNPQWELHL